MEIPMFLLAIVWLYLFVLELAKGLTAFQDILIYIIWALFVFEFLLKLFLSPRKISYIKRNWITVIALIVPALRVFRLLNALRLLQSTRFISSTHIIRALTSGKRFWSALKEAQGPAPEPEMHIGILIEYSKTEKLDEIKIFSEILAADVIPKLEEGTEIKWHFHIAEPARLESDKAVKPSAFLDDSSLLMAEGPYDAILVVTDVMLVSKENKLSAGLASPTSRIIVLSTGKITSTGRDRQKYKLADDIVRWNGAKLLLQLFGFIMGLKSRKPTKTSVMNPVTFSEDISGVPSFRENEKKILRKNVNHLPERELKGGNALETFVFHILMALRHPKDLFYPLLRNRAILLPLALPGLATAAVAPSFILVFTAEIWDVGLHMTNSTATIFAIISIITASFYLVKVQSLFLPRKEKRIITEHLAVANSVIYLTIFIACIGLFLMVAGLMMVIETWIFPADLMQTWPTLDKKVIMLQDKLRLAVFISTVGVITGALAGGFESRTVIQHLALFRETH